MAYDQMANIKGIQGFHKSFGGSSATKSQSKVPRSPSKSGSMLSGISSNVKGMIGSASRFLTGKK